MTHLERLKARRERKKLERELSASPAREEKPELREASLSEEEDQLVLEVRKIRVLLERMNFRDAVRSGEEV